MTTTDASRAARAQAEGLLRAGRTEEAIGAYRDLLAADPSRADDWFNLGWLERGARRHAQALDAYGEALARGVARPAEVHVNRAAILSEQLGDVAGAERELRRAVSLDPRFTLAWLNLGNLHEDLGAVDEARAAYEAALEAEPGHGRALARLTMIDLFADAAGGRIDALHAGLRRPALDADQVAEMLFALGAALDAERRYDEAFAAVAQANRLVRDRLGAAGRYDPAAHERLVDALIAAPPLPAVPEAAGGPEPIFICGLFRSGSTLAEQLLARHSGVTACGELDVVPWLAVERLGNDPAGWARLTAEDIAGFRDIYVDRLRTLHPDAALVTDKRSDNFLYLGLVKAMFPAARIVHTVRDPLDNILSIFFLYFADSIRYGWMLEDIAHWYLQYRRIMDHWRARYAGDIVELSYDALIADPARVLAATQRFCGLPPELLADAPPDTAPVRTASAWQVRKPLHARSSGRWRHYPAAAARIRELIGSG